MKKVIFLFSISLMLFQSCATICTGRYDTVHFDSKPPGAVVKINGDSVGVTPCDIRLKRRINKQLVTYTKDGYETEMFELGTKFNWVACLNTVDVLCWGVDCLTGSVVRYSPLFYKKELKKS